MQNIKIYTAGKTWAAHWFKQVRDSEGFNVNARWIDFQQVLSSFDDTHSEEVLNDEETKQDLWDNGCKIDCLNCDMMVMACHPNDGDKHSGSLVELGHVTAFNKPVYIFGTCASVEPVGHSDRAWKAQRVVHHWPEYDVTDPRQLAEAMWRAVYHYQENYA
jgi:nucleoside 2-deoxyribosyltransferase